MKPPPYLQRVYWRSFCWKEQHSAMFQTAEHKNVNVVEKENQTIFGFGSNTHFGSLKCHPSPRPIPPRRPRRERNGGMGRGDGWHFRLANTLGANTHFYGRFAFSDAFFENLARRLISWQTLRKKKSTNCLDCQRQRNNMKPAAILPYNVLWEPCIWLDSTVFENNHETSISKIWQALYRPCFA